MAEIKIQLRDFTNNILGNLDITTSENFPLSLSYSHFDVRSFSRRTGSFSKTFKIPATKKNNKLFNHIYEYGHVDSQNSYGKIPATIFADNLPIITGKLRITQIFRDKDILEYECLFLGNNMDWADTIKGLNLSELKFSNQTYTDYDSIIETDYSFSDPRTQPFSNYSTNVDHIIYPLITVGEGDADANRVMSSDFIPHVYIKSVWNKIFNAQGYKVVSTFCDSDFFENLVMPLIFQKPKSVTDVSLGKVRQVEQELLHTIDVSENYGNSVNVPRDINNSSYTIDFVDSGLAFGGGSTSAINLEFVAAGIGNQFIIQDDAPNASDTVGNAQKGHTHAADSDGNVRSNMLCVASQSSGVFRLTGSIEFKVRAGQQDTINFFGEKPFSHEYKITARLVKASSDDGFDISSDSNLIVAQSVQQATITGTIIPQGQFQNIHTFNIDETVNANQGDLFFLTVKYESIEFLLIDQSGLNAEIQLLMSGDTNLQIEQTAAFFNGDTFSNVGRLLPKGKQIDFIKGISELFNLQYHTNPISKEVFVEPYDHFYDSISSETSLDWTDKVDYSKQIKDEFIHEIKSRLLLKYKDASNDAMLEAFNKRNIVDWGAYEEDFTDGNFSSGELVIDNSYFSSSFNWYEPNYIVSSEINRSPVIPMYFTEVVSLAMSGATERPEKNFNIGARILIALKTTTATEYDGDGLPSGNNVTGSGQVNTTYISNSGKNPRISFDEDDIAGGNDAASDFSPPLARFISFDNLTIDFDYNGSNAALIHDPPTANLSQHQISNGYELVDFNLSFSNVTHETILSTSAQVLRGLYELYYSKMIQQLKTNPRLKVVYLNLTHTDITKLDFRKLIYIDGFYYRINKIIDYKPHAKSSTKCELQQYFNLGSSPTNSAMNIDIENINI